MDKKAIKMNVQVINTCEKEVSFTIDKKDIKAATEKILNIANTKVNIPGFRIGKAPKALILKKYNNEIQSQLRDDVMRSAMSALFEEEANHPVIQPEMQEVNIKLDSDCSFKMKIEVAPSFTIPEYKNLKVVREPFVFDEKAVNDQLDSYREKFKSMDKVDRQTEENDFVKCSFKGVLEDSSEVPAEAEAMLNGEGRWIPVKDQSLLPDAKAGLLGKKAGDQVTWTTTFEENYPIEFLKSKKVTYTCTIDEVHGYIIPELNEEFAQKLGFKTIDEIKEILVKELERNHNMTQDSKNKEEVLNQMIENFSCEMPTGLLKSEIARQLHSLKHEKGVAHDCNDAGHDHAHTADCGHTSEQVAAEAELTKEAQKLAEKEIKTKFILRKIAKLENVEVSEREVQMQVYNMARQMQQDPKVLLDNLQRSGSINEFSEHILIDKTLAKILEICAPKEIATAATN